MKKKKKLDDRIHNYLQRTVEEIDCKKISRRLSCSEGYVRKLVQRKNN